MQELIITTTDDPRLPCVIDAPVSSQQGDENDPVFVAVRADATDEQLANCAARTGAQLAELRKVRELARRRLH